MFSTQRIARVALMALSIGAASAHASMVTLTGPSFDLVYDTATLDPLFGAPTLVGNTIHFAPSNFSALSLRGDEDVTRTATTHVQLLLHTGTQLSSVGLLEQGSYTLSGSQSFVDVGGQIRLFDLQNFQNETTSRISPVGSLNVADGLSHDWQASASASLAGALGQATKVNLTIENSLEAYTDGSESGLLKALILKTPGTDGVTIQVSTVPEPESWALGLIGLSCVFATGIARRRSHPLEA